MNSGADNDWAFWFGKQGGLEPLAALARGDVEALNSMGADDQALARGCLIFRAGSYTHLTLPTILRGVISGVAVHLKKKNMQINHENKQRSMQRMS